MWNYNIVNLFYLVYLLIYFDWSDTADSRVLIFLQVSANGNVLRSEIVGSIKMRVFLSGMPELRLGLNDKVLFENTGRESISSIFFLYMDDKRPHAIRTGFCGFYSMCICSETSIC